MAKNTINWILNLVIFIYVGQCIKVLFYLLQKFTKISLQSQPTMSL